MFRRFKMKMNSDVYTMEDDMEQVQQNIQKVHDEILGGIDGDRNQRKLADLTAKESVMAAKIEEKKTDIKLLCKVISESRKKLIKLQDEIFMESSD